MAFLIHASADEPILEVVYPERPDEEDVRAYAQKIRRAIGAMKRPWACVVDQRKLILLRPELVTEIGGLNAFAQDHGMLCSARVVASAVAQLQAARIAREGTVRVPVRTFTERAEAIAWVRGEIGRSARA